LLFYLLDNAFKVIFWICMTYPLWAIFHDIAI
jgi:hypothetical protein